jgi:hypothetical protein
MKKKSFATTIPGLRNDAGKVRRNSEQGIFWLQNILASEHYGFRTFWLQNTQYNLLIKDT